jgi:hypothetical protein
VNGELAPFLERVDVDGALRETRENLASRRRFLGLSAAGLAVALGVRAPTAAARGSALAANDISILNYALGLEYLQSSFYTEAERSGALSGRTAAAARVVGAVERAHVAAFQSLLGAKAIKRPQFDFQGTTEQQHAFLKTAVAFEDLAVAAYKGQAPRLQSDEVLTAAVGIHTVEARHAAWMRELFGITPSLHSFDQPESRAKIERIVASTHFVVSKPQTQKKGQPRYTG